MSRLLVIDAGNTRTKWAVMTLEDGVISTQGWLQQGEILSETVLSAWQECARIGIVNVAGPDSQAWLQACLAPLKLPMRWHTSTAQACGLVNDYSAPAQLGVDRWAAMVAAWQYYQRSCVVVNAGTALTVDLIEKTAPGQGRFMGGIIAPGLRLMQNSIVAAAAGIAPGQGNWQDFPRNTADAVYSGSLQAMCGAVDNMVQKLSEYCGYVVPCMVSGGDASVLLPLLEKHALAREYHLEEQLVLQGLWYLERDAS